MADDVEEIKCVEKMVSDQDKSLETDLKYPKSNCEDNSEATGGEFQGDIAKKESCVDEKQTKTTEDEVAILFENVKEKNDEELFQELVVPTEENRSAEVKEEDLEVEKVENTEDKDDANEDSREELSFAHESVESEMSTHPPADLHPEGTEFRHRNVTEKIQNIEEIPTDQPRDQTKDTMNDHGTADTGRTELAEEEIIFSNVDHGHPTDQETSPKRFSVLKYFLAEISRGYVLELDEDRYADKRKKIYTCMKIPKEVEKLMIFGFMLCLDCFLFMFTFLPVRVLVAMWKLVSGFFCCKKTRLLEPAQICDVLKASIIVIVFIFLENVDFSVLYHTVRGQSVIKLYVIYNMLEVADRLCSSFGQDVLDALFWTATEPRDRKREHVGTLPHFALGVIYVFLHSVLVLFQATCLNVAVNSHNKALLVIMVSNQFVELKGSVFKRFEKNNLFQMACSDIRERFHYLVLVSIVCLRNLTEFNWNMEHLYVIAPYLFATVSSEYFVDWVKHAFITKFNDIPPEVYTEYRSRLAKDAISSRQKNAHADHFDLVSRRMGFIPLSLGALVIRVITHSIHVHGNGGVALIVSTYFFLLTLKILNSIIFLGKAPEYAKEYPDSDETKTKPNYSSSSKNHRYTTNDRPGSSTESTTEQNKKNTGKKSLSEIDRYTLCSKEIVLF
ncbi:transmembrane anterior posterior transformation protein 1 homolog [Actinia tenebrosa]|uniref:Transmembrane anterior posterior transformation protein 1 homolog n=1 Tax=Actinia tenebrosa TaxID=6105 RepID=A0A6P8HJS1_ACTTE|nr:transmembrane anterior posterior transformation protein 1 homolog [Actinia tenebrosa]